MARKTQIPLDDAPEHAAALGRLLGHWAICETQLESITRLLLGLDQFKGRFVWQEFTSTRSKIQMMQRLNHHFTPPQFKDELDKLLGSAKDLNSRRNGFVHAVWGGDERNLTRFETSLPGNYKKSSKEVQTFAPQDIQNVVEEIAELSQALTQWQFRALGVPLTSPAE